VNYRKDALKNGLRVITAPMPRLKSVAVMIIVRAGSRGDEKRTRGIAHFVEHTVFKGTEKRPTPLAILSELDGVGAVSSAFTGKELIGFYVRAASEHLPLALDVLSDIFLNPKFPKEEIERERKVILEERRMYLDNPRDHIYDLYFELVFGDHPLGWDIAGEEETIMRIQRSHLVDYVDRWFKPANTAVVVAGDVDRRKAVAEAARLLDKLKTAEPPKIIPFTPSQRGPRVSIERRKTDQTHFVLGVRSYPLDHPCRYACSVLNTILGVGMSSRLFVEVRQKRGLAYYIGSQMLPYTDVGTLFAFGGVNNKRFKEAISITVGELRRLKEKSVPAKELRKAKEMIKGGLALNLESPGFVARFLAEQELLEKRVKSPEELVRKIDAVTAAEVRRVAQELFVAENLNLAIIGSGLEKGRLLSLLDLL